MMIKYMTLFLCLTLSLLANSDLDKINEKANSAFENNKFEDAIKLYDEALEDKSSNAVLLYNKANSLYKLKKYDEAIGVYQDAKDQDGSKYIKRAVHFNLGNSHYKKAEEKTSQAKKEEDYRAILGIYQSAFDNYRIALKLSREISIKEGREFHKSGKFIKKNWALARVAWTRTWEKIRQLEKKNLKLLDGINNFKQAQGQAIKRLEQTYLSSFDQDVLQYRMTLLAQQQEDLIEDLLNLKKISAKDLERLTAELKNLKDAQKQQQQPQQPNVPAAPNEEVAKLEKELKFTEQINEAIIQLESMENFLLDLLKKSQFEGAWNYLNQINKLLGQLSAALAEQDPIKVKYHGLKIAFAESKVYLEKLKELEALPQTQKHLTDLKGRLNRLASIRLEQGAQEKHDLDLINERLSEFINKKPDQEEKKIEEMNHQEKLKHIESKMLKRALVSLIRKNLQYKTKMQENLKTLNLAKLKEISDGLNEVVVRYNLAAEGAHKVISVTLAETFLLEYKIFDEAESKKFTDLEFNKRFNNRILTNEKVNDYLQIIASFKDESYKTIREKVSENIEPLNTAWEEIEKHKLSDLKDKVLREKFSKDLSTLQDELFSVLSLLNIDEYFKYKMLNIRSWAEKAIVKLPSTADNKSRLIKINNILSKKLFELSYSFKELIKALSIEQEKSKNEEQKKAISSLVKNKQKAALYLNRGLENINKQTAFLNDKKFQSYDFTIKDLNELITKSTFYNNLLKTDAVKLLKKGIDDQTKIKQNTDIAIRINSEEDTLSHLANILKNNQNDVIELCTEINSAIREMKTQASQQATQAPAQPNLQPGQPQPKVNTQNFDDAIKLVQEAMMETEKVKAFFAAAELSNTTNKHDVIIDKLKEALKLLEDPNKKNQNQQGNDQNQNNQQQKQDQQQQDKNQNQQQNHGSKPKPKPLEMSSEEARQLLKQLNADDKEKTDKNRKAKGSPVKGPRPW